MGAADLSGIQRKAARAKAKLDALRDEIAAYLDPPPFRFAVEIRGHEQTIVTYIDNEPKEGWEDEFGEIAYQARSALDLLVVQLAIDSGTANPKGTNFRSSSTGTSTSRSVRAAPSGIEC